jgi:UDP-2,3-diacylglucosamine pyrophosphatase LpxH
LVIAGDFVDFVGMSVAADPGEIATNLTEEEQMHGLGGAADHARAKMRRVVEHHADVFKALSEFVAAGNTLVVLRGNHDVDLHWEEVQDEFRRGLERFGTIERGNVEFAPWFYYEEGVVYVEHGHQYDQFCSYENVLYPVQPSDPRRTARSLSDILLRFVVRPTRGMRESGHADAGVADYLRFAWRLGTSGMLKLVTRFLSAVTTLIQIWREHFSEAAQWVRSEHERKLTLLAEAKQISLERLRALITLQRPPVTRSLLAILASVMLDRILLVVLAAGLLAGALKAIDHWPYICLVVVCTLGVVIGLGVLWNRLRNAIDPSTELRDGAQRVARLFPAAFVVMGHTHLPEVRPTPNADAVYVNLGAWAEEESEDAAAPVLPATRTHLVLTHVNGKPTGELLTWHRGAGPRPFIDAKNETASS